MKRLAPTLAAVALLWFAAGFCVQRLPSADLWWLLADGREVWQTGTVPKTDPFSWTAAGAAWHNDQWLAGALWFKLYQWGGLSALHGSKAVLLMLTLALAWDTGWRLQTRRSLLGLMLATAVALGAAEARFFFDVRAYLFSYLFLMLVWRWIQLGTRPPLAVVGLLFALWSNLHAGLSSGLLLLGLAALFHGPPQRGYWWRALAAALLGSLANPSGAAVLLHPLLLLGSPWQRYLNEWQPVWRRPEHFGWHLLHLLAWVGVWLRTSWQPADRCLLGMALLSLTGWRHIPLFALLSLPRWAQKLQLSSSPPLLLGLAGLMTAWTASRPLHLLDPRQSGEGQWFPRWACTFLAANRLPPKLFQPYGVGGYVLWRNAPNYQVCIDGRAVQVYPFSAYADYLRAAYDPGEFEKFCAREDVRLAMLFAGPRTEAGSQLARPAFGWREIYRDELVIVVVRQWSGPLVSVETPYSLCQQAAGAAREQALPRLERALQLEPGYFWALYQRAVWDLRAGQAQSMLALAQQHPLRAEIHQALALFYRGKNERAAHYHARRVRELAPGSELDRSL